MSEPHSIDKLSLRDCNQIYGTFKIAKFNFDSRQKNQLYARICERTGYKCTFDYVTQPAFHLLKLIMYITYQVTSIHQAS